MKKQMARHFTWLPTSSFNGFAEMTSVCMVKRQLSVDEREKTRRLQKLRSYPEVIALGKEESCLLHPVPDSAALAG
jgi:hypothetical protein